MNEKQLQTLKNRIIIGNEGRKFEFKQELPLSSKPEKAKFAQIVSAVANSPGGKGYIVIGVIDKKNRKGTTLDDALQNIEYDYDIYNNMISDALKEYVHPIPNVIYEEIEIIKNKKIGVITIQTSKDRPHEIKRESDKITEGIYIRRGTGTFRATRDEIMSMTDKSIRTPLIINMAREFTEWQLQEMNVAKIDTSYIIPSPYQKIEFDMNMPLAQQVKGICDELPLTNDEWETLDIIVNLPGLAPAAAAILAEMHGRMGHFPDILVLKKSTVSPNEFVFSEVVHLQGIRNEARV
jgi:hypothetical protein